MAAGLVGLFLAFDLGLFAWLIFRSLSQRELDRTLLETRAEAQNLAGRLTRSAERTGGDLFTAVALAQETQTYIDSVLRQRRIVQTVEIRDRNGVLVMKERREAEISVPAPDIQPSAELSPGTPRVETRTVERKQTNDLELPPGGLGTIDVTVPIGEFGSLRIGISQSEMEQRIAILRGELLRQTTVIGGLTLGIVGVAFALISVLIRRGERLETQAAEAERLAYLGTLAAGLAHEIRNPLNSLNLNMQMLSEDLGNPAAETTGRRLLAITSSEIGRLERLVTDFLAYARPRALKLEEVPAIDLLRAAREVTAAQAAARGAEVRIDDESGGARVNVDPEQIQQLLLNLIQNALTATEGAGRRPEIVLSARADEDRVELSVRDNGRGIPDTDKARIFEIFFSTRKGGTGLGLAIADRIALAHGGTLAFETEEGYGARFWISLPLAGSEASPARAAL
ncbi:MAG: multi-sensor signal transduction histidine kinase [Acidobacteria bacterium]|nr:multi-sensor signal transduction histidine kinase [Acidobacteriota bacterium]